MRWLIGFLVACGGSPPEEAPRPVGPPAALVAQPTGPDDVVVATVGGQPVWGSCVAQQATRGAKTREAALAECIDFELLAQAATRFSTDPEVIDETHRAAVSRLVEREFERRYRTPADVADRLERELARAMMTEFPELRASAYIRVAVPEKGSTPEIERTARALADEIHAVLANEVGLFPSHVEEIAKTVAKGRAIEFKQFRAVPRGIAEPHYDAAMFSIPEVGRVSEVTRTQWGWDIVLLTERVEAKHPTREELVPRAFEYIRAKLFQEWVDSLEKTSQIAKNEAVLGEDK